ncbi:6-methylsalicylic acid decarboxylase atA [Sparassis crispa]|uniref:6-methylsalicylic acid decarboxylase atA n=1 Tax=Sparassis crispa TaxID=139825 RepID=A0A401GUA5_9APHY|nr:6-methylsalicylic acid decarboxylase atA [Sparassis crispa]GBE85786.1 6-methylsalicylic acid decarboxylase atA [Sparassis crispa]
MSDNKLRVAIIGAGIGGLVFALSLHKSNEDIIVDIYESNTKLTEHGAGIGMWPRPWTILDDLGLAEDLQAISVSQADFTFRKCDQAEGIDFPSPIGKYGPVQTFHRAEFQTVLSKHLPLSYNVHFSKRLVSYTGSDSGDIVLSFQDGSLAICDVVVGCDGVRSAVRGTLYRSLAEKAEHNGDHVKAVEALSHVDATYSGTSAYRSLIPTNLLVHKHPGHGAVTGPLWSFGKDKHVVVFPISQGTMINVVVFISERELEGTVYNDPWVVPTATEEIIRKFAFWNSEVRSLLECSKNASLWAINTVVGLPTFVGERVALLGDAAHAMTPHQGSGAGQAFEDGYILASLLGHPSVTRATVHRALQAYDAIRRPFAQEVQRRSRSTGMLCDLSGPEFEGLTEEQSTSGTAVSSEELIDISKAVDRMMDWMNEGSVMEDRNRALQLLVCT